jgi:hypothetical protein
MSARMNTRLPLAWPLAQRSEKRMTCMGGDWKIKNPPILKAGSDAS